VVAAAVWAAFRSGLLPDARIGIRVSALRSDWLLAGGALISLGTFALAAVASAGDRRWSRRLADDAAAGALGRRLLLSRLDHELKNPLTAMRAALANVSATAAPADRDAGLRSIEAQVLRLSRLTADLRKLADVENTAVDRRPVDVAALLEEAIEIAREQPGAADRTLSLDLPHAPWPLPPVSGDWELLSLAFGNLVDNALKYTEPGDRIEVRAREAAGSVVVEVADTGPGIDPADLGHIWEELYRSPRVRAVAGSGLGLALVRAVVQAHGGVVEAESRLGRGTVMRIQLPVRIDRPHARTPVDRSDDRQKAADPAT
jgi:two-component system OmpR family sensor kinase